MPVFVPAFGHLASGTMLWNNARPHSGPGFLDKVQTGPHNVITIRIIRSGHRPFRGEDTGRIGEAFRLVTKR